MGLIAAAAFKSSQPASESVAVALPAAPAGTRKAAGVVRPKAKVVHAVAKSEPAANDAVSPLPRSYAILLTHCLFSSKPTASASKAGSHSEAEYTLRGVFQRGRRCVAYIENTTSHEAQEFNVGEPLGVGKLTSIDFNGVRFDAAGRNLRVEVGQSFGNARKVASAETSSISTFRQITE
jgi:hypothetical protein